MSAAHALFMKHLQQLDEAQVRRLFPTFGALVQVFPREVALQICLMGARHPGGFDIDTATQCSVCQSNHLPILATNTKCKSRGCNWGWTCVTSIRSRHPLYHLEFFELVSPNSLNKQVGIGVTTNPDNPEGFFRFNTEACGIDMDSGNLYYGLVGEGGEARIGVRGILKSGRPVPITERRNLGVAVDYERNQILLKWPKCGNILRLDLPHHLRNQVLYPLAQAWNGCGLEFARVRNIEASELANSRNG